MSFSVSILFVLHYIVPTVFLFLLWTGDYRTSIDWLLNLSVAAAYIIFIYLAGHWDWVGYYLRFVLLAALLATTFKSLTQVERLPVYLPGGLTDWLEFGFFLFLLIVFARLLGTTVTGYWHKERSIDLAFPLRDGRFYIGHGGNSLSLNAHQEVDSQKFALDVVQLNNLGLRARGIYPKELAKYRIYGTPVYAPTDGLVVLASDGMPDLTPPESDPSNPAGNLVVIQPAGTELFVMLAHLQTGSVVVEGGQTVKRGQLIGRVGNSGNASEPHLHIHCVRGVGQSYMSGGQGVPMRFKGRFLTRNSLVTN